jgi:hypothetical protein
MISCDGKIKYESKDQANQSAYVLMAESAGGELVRSYRCKKCKKWHLTKFER